MKRTVMYVEQGIEVTRVRRKKLKAKERPNDKSRRFSKFYFI